MNDRDQTFLRGLQSKTCTAAWMTKQLKAGADPNVSEDDETALCMVFRAKRYDLARILLWNKADPNFPLESNDPEHENDAESNTPFWSSAMQGDLAACAIMLCESTRSIALGQCDHEGTPFIASASRNDPFWGWFFLLLARYHGTAVERKNLWIRAQRLGEKRYAKQPDEKVLFGKA